MVHVINNMNRHKPIMLLNVIPIFRIGTFDTTYTIILIYLSIMQDTIVDVIVKY